MAFKSYEWDQENTSHIFDHQVAPNEVEECCHNDPLVLKASRGRYLVFGQSSAGRYLFVVVEPKKSGEVRPITARDMERSERKLYHKKKKR